MLTKCQCQLPINTNKFNDRTDWKTFDAIFLENINDIAEALAEIMIVCGIHHCKAKATKSTIIKSFKFYDIKRHRFGAAAERGICRSYIVCKLKSKCKMTHIEALLAYIILKRALKAFFHGLQDFSIRSPITEAVILKEQEFMWQHAAFKTNQLFQRFEHMFFHAKQNYKKNIVDIYKNLYERLKKRADPVIVEDYNLTGCVKKVIVGTKSPPKLDSEIRKTVEMYAKTKELKKFIKNLPSKEFPLTNNYSTSKFCEIILAPKKAALLSLHVDKPSVKIKSKSKNYDINLLRCYQCNSPQLMCDCKIERDTGILAIDCSQGPYECQWVRVDNNDEFDPCMEKKVLHQCPVDCTTSESSSSESDGCQSLRK